MNTSRIVLVWILYLNSSAPWTTPLMFWHSWLIFPVPLPSQSAAPPPPPPSPSPHLGHFSRGHRRPLNWLNSWPISLFVALNMNCLFGYLNATRSLSESGAGVVATILDLRDRQAEFRVSCASNQKWHAAKWCTVWQQESPRRWLTGQPVCN